MLLYLFSGGHGDHLAKLFSGPKRFYDGQRPMTGCYFKGWLLDGNVNWDFSATCHGKGDIIDGLDPKTLAHTSDVQNSIDFAKRAAVVCPGITVPHCSKTDAEEIQEALDNFFILFIILRRY